MRKFRSAGLAAGILLLGSGAGLPAQAQSHWKAGVASIVITPQEPMWMAGYGNRTKPSEGVLQDIRAKALVLEDETGANQNSHDASQLACPLPSAAGRANFPHRPTSTPPRGAGCSALVGGVSSKL